VSELELDVRVVAADRMVWSGEAASLIARTLIGEIGILPRHEPVLALLDDGEVRITLADESVLRVAVHHGFLTVDSDSVTILADSAELADDIDVSRAEAALSRAQGDANDDEAAAALRRAEVRLEVAARN
jgi:F-type H+-transporting ATPase subunit epsilon